VNNDEMGTSMSDNKVQGEYLFAANGGMNMKDAYLSGRKAYPNGTGADWPMTASSGYFSFGAPAAPEINGLQEGDYYQFQLSTFGFDDVNLSIRQRITGGGPGDFVLLYSYTGNEDDYHDMGVSLTRRYSGTVEVTDLIMLPEECWDQPVLYLRLTVVGDTAQGGGKITTSGTWGIDDIVFSSGLDDRFLNQYLTVEVDTPQELLSIGDTANVEVKVTNISSFNIEDVNVHMGAPYFAVTVSGSLDTTISIQPGQTVTLRYSFIVLEGGREPFIAMLEKNGAKLSGFNGITVAGAV
jgi:hypothetical protein